MSKIQLITHGEDVDGIIASALLRKYLVENHEKNIGSQFISYSTQTTSFEQIANTIKAKEIYVADLNYNPALEESVKKMANFSDSLVWIDHHSGTQKNKNLLEQMGGQVIDLPENNCASKLVHENYLPNDDYSLWLSNIAQKHDYPKTIATELEEKNGQDLQKIITLYNVEELDKKQANLDILSIKLAAGTIWTGWKQLSDQYQDILQSYEKKKGNAQEILDESKELIKIGDKKILFAYGHPILPSKETLLDLRISHRSDADGYMVLFGNPVNNALFFKSPESEFDAAKFCSYMGGGGRGGDGGFSLQEQIGPEAYHNKKQEIIEKLGEYLSS